MRTVAQLKKRLRELETRVERLERQNQAIIDHFVNGAFDASQSPSDFTFTFEFDLEDTDDDLGT